MTLFTGDDVIVKKCIFFKYKIIWNIEFIFANINALYLLKRVCFCFFIPKTSDFGSTANCERTSENVLLRTNYWERTIENALLRTNYWERTIENELLRLNQWEHTIEKVPLENELLRTHYWKRTIRERTIENVLLRMD